MIHGLAFMGWGAENMNKYKVEFVMSFKRYG